MFADTLHTAPPLKKTNPPDLPTVYEEEYLAVHGERSHGFEGTGEI